MLSAAQSQEDIMCIKMNIESVLCDMSGGQFWPAPFTGEGNRK